MSAHETAFDIDWARRLEASPDAPARRGSMLVRFAVATGVVVVALVAASIVVFLLVRLMPTTPMEAFLHRQGLPVTEENLANLRQQWGLDEPVIRQYWSWVSGLLSGDWGTSTVTGAPIGPQLVARVPLSLTIGFGALLLGWLLAYALGMLASLHGGWWQGVVDAITVASQAIPAFLIAVVIINLFGVQLRWVSFYSLGGPAVTLAPMLVLGILTGGHLSRTVTEHADELATEPFVQAELGRGFSRSRVMWRHGRRHVLYGMLSASIAKVATVTGGVAILEFTFAVPGINLYLIESIQKRDYAVIQGYLMLVAAWVGLSYVVVNSVLALIDPRVRR